MATTSPARRLITPSFEFTTAANKSMLTSMIERSDHEMTLKVLTPVMKVYSGESQTFDKRKRLRESSHIRDYGDNVPKRNERLP